MEKYYVYSLLLICTLLMQLISLLNMIIKQQIFANWIFARKKKKKKNNKT